MVGPPRGDKGAEEGEGDEAEICSPSDFLAIFGAVSVDKPFFASDDEEKRDDAPKEGKREMKGG